MERSVSAHIDLSLSGRSDLVFAVAVSQDAHLASEEFTLTVDGTKVKPEELLDVHGTRLHQLITDGKQVALDYEATVIGQSQPASVEDRDLITYLRPSRYCESDLLGPTAASEFSGLEGAELLDAVNSWVYEKLTYVTGSSLPTDGAVRTMLNRKGVCRDFAHLAIAMLRALNVPARMAAVYAPGINPMEFHAVCEAYIDDGWYVVDATRKAPRQSLLRIATGRDAADTAFLTTLWSGVTLNDLGVTAVVDQFPRDDWTSPVQLN